MRCEIVSILGEVRVARLHFDDAELDELAFHGLQGALREGREFDCHVVAHVVGFLSQRESWRWSV